MELEFTNDDGEGTGRRLYLQLKSGNSHLTKCKTDGTEIFTIKKQRWVEYWLQQPHPVLLVIGTFSEDDERAIGKDKLEFAEVRWMEITSVLKRESANGTKPVKQIEFKRGAARPEQRATVASVEDADGIKSAARHRCRAR